MQVIHLSSVIWDQIPQTQISPIASDNLTQKPNSQNIQLSNIRSNDAHQHAPQPEISAELL